MKNRLACGIVAIAIPTLITYGLTGSVLWAMLVGIVTLVFLPPSYDPAIIWKEHLEPKPSCFGDLRPGQFAAERDCSYCPVYSECSRETVLRVRYRKD